MADSSYILAHDLGTTGNKATLFRRDGRVAAATVATYPTAYPQANWAEQDPKHWRRALFSSTRQLLKEAGISSSEIAVVSFSGHMNGLVSVDKAGTPLRPAIIWADQRAVEQAAAIADTCGEDEVYRLTGNRISAGYPAAKWLWIKTHEPDVYHNTHLVLQTKDYAAYLFCAEFATDYSDASMTLLMDLTKREWAGELIEQLGLDTRKLADIYPAATVIGGVSDEAARETGLRTGTAVVIGGGDGACATVGAGSIAAGDTYNYIGSSSWIALSASRPILDPKRRTFNIAHLDPDLYIPLGTMQAAGGAFDWFERLLRPEDHEHPQYEALDEAAAAVPPGSHGLLFLPYLLGERSPYWNPFARGAFVGLSMSHGKPETTRALLEGVAFHLRSILTVLKSQGTEIETGIRLIGGGARSTLWRQILADVYQLPVARLNLSVQATALGAAIAGGVGVGLYPDYKIGRDLAPIHDYQYPQPETSPLYEPYFKLFEQTYVALEPIFTQLAKLDQS
ncbi:MAG: xylulokinase [Chloroflexi bacterium]|nr:xylulokinase [Chloroflexota bacterium]